MRRDDEQVLWLRAANAVRLGGQSGRTAARRCGAMDLPYGVPRPVLLCAVDPDLCRRAAGLAAAAARADRIALAVTAAERQAILAAVGPQARAFAIARRADLARGAGFAAPDEGDLATELVAAVGRIETAILARARGCGAAALPPCEEAALAAALTEASEAARQVA